MSDAFADVNGLYRRYASDVFRFALYLTGERSDADDITAETFVRVWTSDRAIHEETVKAFLFTIARNLHLQMVRNGKRYVALENDLLDRHPDPLAQAESRSEHDAVTSHMTRLPDTDRAALLLRATEGMSYESIARTLDISVSSAKAKVHRARLALAALR